MRRLDAGNTFVHAAVRTVAIGAQVPEPPEEPAWRERAAQHGVLSIIAEHLQPRVDDELRAVRRRRTVHHLRTMADLRFVQKSFDEAGIGWLVFKGPVLSEIIYQRPGARDCGDLDVLVHPRDVGPAVDRLLDQGVVPLRGDWRGVRAQGDGECEFLLPHGTPIDLHWDVINDGRVRPSFSVPTGKLFAASRAVRIDDQDVRTFSPVDTVLHAALHGCRSGGDRLRWLLDLQQSLLRCDAESAEILERAKVFRVELVLRTMLNRLALFVCDRGLPRLPAPTAGQRTWLAADTFAMTRYPPGSRYQGRFSGAIMTDSTRAGAARSWATLLGVAPRTLRERHTLRHDKTARPSHNPL
ncbi:MAG TPA: nucleotidyltransferase family protein [Pseudonocardiaceae bacterium]|nr:nucleotidyltransferase family protein [Pseudonocardiaceae bacterium]